MKLATLKSSERDGSLVVVSRDHSIYQHINNIPNLQYALDNWSHCEAQLQQISEQLNNGGGKNAHAFDFNKCHSPLPRAYQWADGSAYVNHVELVRRARGVDLPAEFWSEPLMYQGGSDSFVAPYDPIYALSEDWGIDLEGELAVITGTVAMGASAAQTTKAIRLIMLVNDVSLRNLIPAELAKGFGFFQSKPASAFSPIAVTPDEFGDDWRDGRVHLPLTVHINGELFGNPNAGKDMIFNFPQLIAHAAKTRELTSGSIIGSGTVSNKQGGLHGSSIKNGGVGYCCLAELRTYETIETGKPISSFLRFNDKVRIEMFDRDGKTLMGAIEQQVTPYPKKTAS